MLVGLGSASLPENKELGLAPPILSDFGGLLRAGSLFQIDGLHRAPIDVPDVGTPLDFAVTPAAQAAVSPEGAFGCEVVGERGPPSPVIEYVRWRVWNSAAYEGRREENCDMPLSLLLGK